ncbi:MAG: polysaccharide deacetylase family protein, partial [Bacteroidota bacterium]
WLESDFMNNEGEIIIVNDGSNEDLEEIKLLNTKRIKVIHCKENKGPANARNIGCKNAKYEMLFFSDSDHIVPPDILSKHSARHLKMPSEGIVIGCVFGRRTFSIVSPEIQPHRKEKLLELLQWNKDFTAFASMIALGKPVQFIVDGSISKVWEQAKTISFTDSWLSDWGKIILKFGEDLKDYQYRWTRVSTGSMSIKKSVFATIGGFDENLKSMEDWEFGIRTQKNNYSIVCAPEAEPFHQIHPVDETRNGNDQLAISILLSKHKGFIENLLNYKGSFAPPSYKFLKQVYKRNIRHQNSLIPKFDFPKKQKLATDFCLISFDDGPHPIGTRMVLEVLKKHNAKAVFFLLGSRISDNEELVTQIINEGHELGIHSWIHTPSENFTTLEMTDLLKKTVNEVQQLTKTKPKYARPPYGRLTPSYLQACKKLNLEVVGWDLSAKDWSAISEKEIITRIAIKEINKQVILFHDGVGTPEYTVKALDWLLNICNQSKIKPLLPNQFKQQKELPKLEIYNPYL